MILDNNFNSEVKFKTIVTDNNILEVNLVNDNFTLFISENAKTLMFTDIEQSTSKFCLLTNDKYLDIFDTLEDLETYRTENNLDDSNSDYFEIAPKQLNLGCLRLLQFIYENFL